MAVTPNFSWPVPVATDYVKDGWEAISDLGNAIDTTVAGLGSGLNLVKSQTIGTGVSSVTVSDAFSATYKNYRIIISGGSASSSAGLNMTLGSTNTGYYNSRVYVTFSSTSVLGSVTTNGASWGIVGLCASAGINAVIDIFNPYETDETYFTFQASMPATAGEMNVGSGFLNNTTSYTAFTFGHNAAGTLTGGLVRVYGYEV